MPRPLHPHNPLVSILFTEVTYAVYFINKGSPLPTPPHRALCLSLPGHLMKK
jgi:hypothetical protein